MLSAWRTTISALGIHSTDAMRYIEAPDWSHGDLRHPSLFLAGGITGCPDWQEEIFLLLGGQQLNLTIYNPRRKDFPIDDPKGAEEQITWEHARLRTVDFILFWFPEESVCPIALYELGAWTPQKKTLFVGCHPNYPRRQDVVIQTDLVRPGMPIYSSVSDLAVAVKSYL